MPISPFSSLQKNTAPRRQLPSLLLHTQIITMLVQRQDQEYLLSSLLHDLLNLDKEHRSLHYSAARLSEPFWQSQYSTAHILPQQSDCSPSQTSDIGYPSRRAGPSPLALSILSHRHLSSHSARHLNNFLAQNMNRLSSTIQNTDLHSGGFRWREKPDSKGLPRISHILLFSLQPATCIPADSSHSKNRSKFSAAFTI